MPCYVQVICGGLITQEQEQPNELVAVEVAQGLLKNATLEGDRVRVLSYFGEVLFQREVKSQEVAA